jgi:hypothetical protein
MLIYREKLNEKFNNSNIKPIINIISNYQNTYICEVGFKRIDGFKKAQKMSIPHLSDDKKYIVYNNSVYANSIVGLPYTEDIRAYINGIEEFNPAYKLKSICFDATSPKIDSILYKSVGINESSSFSDLLNLDSWYYCRISDFINTYLIEIYQDLIEKQFKYNKFSFGYFKSSLNSCLSMFRYIGKINEVSDYQIEDLSGKVRIPQVFRQLFSMPNLKSDMLDFTDCSQSAQFDQFSLKQGVTIQ